MIAFAPHISVPLEHAVDGARHPDRNSHDASRERCFVVSLDEQVHMIRLHRKVNHAKPRPRGSCDSPAHFEENHLFTQARNAPPRAQRHMHRVPRLVLRPRPMRDATRRNALAALTTALAVEIERELAGGESFHEQ
jgi:hypothetical protein